MFPSSLRRRDLGAAALGGLTGGLTAASPAWSQRAAAAVAPPAADVVLAASGTVTIEAALLNAPMVTFYRVNPVSWVVGKPLVRVPFYSMVNLVAGALLIAALFFLRTTSKGKVELAEG